MENRLDPEQLRELTEGRRRMTDQLSATELAELVESRRSKFDKLTQDEIAEKGVPLRNVAATDK